MYSTCMYGISIYDKGQYESHETATLGEAENIINGSHTKTAPDAVRVVSRLSV